MIVRRPFDVEPPESPRSSRAFAEAHGPSPRSAPVFALAPPPAAPLAPQPASTPWWLYALAALAVLGLALLIALDPLGRLR